MSRILVIDDEDAVRAALCKALTKLGHTAYEAADGKKGLAVFHEHAPDVVITDLVMPETEGLEVVMTLRGSHPDLKIIAISGGGRRGATDNLRMARYLGASRVIPKPMTIGDLKATLDDLKVFGNPPQAEVTV
ncbi:MAG TPA: response regulator [Opitutaceae bacterium]